MTYASKNITLPQTSFAGGKYKQYRHSIDEWIWIKHFDLGRSPWEIWKIFATFYMYWIFLNYLSSAFKETQNDFKRTKRMEMHWRWSRTRNEARLPPHLRRKGKRPWFGVNFSRRQILQHGKLVRPYGYVASLIEFPLNGNVLSLNSVKLCSTDQPIKFFRLLIFRHGIHLEKSQLSSKCFITYINR